ncbi:hypothetical protein Acr_05g0007460 [Actinidia rufa]|uniref:Secreted protein n=1 Tax=Actinidia rufa TaxID=165716 RepID=A0A7J0ENF0_9ERIC|nr:hypothetical protein Acr_05g0007460 [Actinidia rufa]
MGCCAVVQLALLLLHHEIESRTTVLCSGDKMGCCATVTTVTRSCSDDLLAVCGLGELLNESMTVVGGGWREEIKKVKEEREIQRRLCIACGCGLKGWHLRRDRQPTGTCATYLRLRFG